MIPTKPLFALLIVASFLAGCAAQEGTPTPTTGTPAGTTPATATPTPGGSTTLRVGTDAAFPPFEELTASGAYEGFDIDVMNEIGERNGWTIEFQNLAFDTLIPSLENGQIDAIISAMSVTDERSQVVDFSVAYYEANQSVAKLATDTRTFSSLEDLKGKGITFGAQSGTVAVDIIEEQFAGDELKRYDTYPLAIAAMKAGEVDVVVMDAPAQHEAASGDSAIEVAFEFSVGDVYGIALAKGSDRLDEVNDALEAMQDDGTLAELREKWGI